MVLCGVTMHLRRREKAFVTRKRTLIVGKGETGLVGLGSWCARLSKTRRMQTTAGRPLACVVGKKRERERERRNGKRKKKNERNGYCGWEEEEEKIGMWCGILTSGKQQ